MIKKLTFAVLLITLVLSPLLAGCNGSDIGPSVYRQVSSGAPPILDNQVVATQVGQMVYGLQQVILEAAGTRPMLRETAEGAKQLLFMWSGKSSWYFVGIDTATMESIDDIIAIGGANQVNAKTMKELIAWAEDAGWRTITARDIPEVLKITIAQLPIILQQYAASWYTFIVYVPGTPPSEYINALDLGGGDKITDQEFLDLLLQKEQEWH